MNTEKNPTEAAQNQSIEGTARPEKMHFKFNVDAKTSDDNANAIATHVNADISCDEDFAINVFLGIMEEHSEFKRIILKAAAAYASRGLRKFVSDMGADLRKTMEDVEKEIDAKKSQETAEPNV